MALGSTFVMPGDDTTINDTGAVEVCDIMSDTGSVNTEEGKLHGPKIARLVGHSTVGNNIQALMVKRFHIYRRDILNFICEIFVPWVMLLIGCGLASLNYDKI